MDIRNLEYILTIAEERSLSRAAEKLYVSQPALSQYLCKLEEELKAELFTRHKNQLSLTDSGKVYLNGAKSILRVKKEGELKLNQLKNPVSTKIKIGLNNHLQSFFYSNIIQLYKHTNPKITFDIKVIDSKEAFSVLDESAVDLVLIMKNFELENSPVISSVNLLYDEIVMICNGKVNYLTFSKSANSIISKINLPMVLFKENSKFRKVQNEIINKYKIVNEILCEVESFDTILRTVSSNSAISFVPKSLLENNRNYYSYNIFPETKKSISIYYKNNSSDFEPIKNFVSLIKDIRF